MIWWRAEIIDGIFSALVKRFISLVSYCNLIQVMFFFIEIYGKCFGGAAPQTQSELYLWVSCYEARLIGFRILSISV